MLKLFGRKKKTAEKPPLAAGGGDEDGGEVDEHKDNAEDLDGDAMYYHDDDVEEDEQFDEDDGDEDLDHPDNQSEEDSEDFRGKPKYAKEFDDDSSSQSESLDNVDDDASRAYSEKDGDDYCYGYYGMAAGGGKSRHHQNHGEEVKEDGSDDIAAMRAATAARNAKFTRFLGKDEKVRASQVFKLLDVHREGKIDNEGFATALSLLGMKITSNECNELFLSRGFDLVDEKTFVSMVGEYRASDDEQIRQIEGAFEDLYRGILAEREGGFVEQRDGIGRPYILAKDLRNLLVTSGDTLTDEEADSLISSCKPIYKVHSDGTVTGKIFFEQYRTMLLPGPH